MNDRRPQTADRRPQTADRRPQTADRRPQTADRRPQTADRRPQTADRRPQTADRRPQTADRRPQTADRRPQTADRRPQTADRRPQTADRRPQTADRRPQTADRRPQTADRRPQTAKLKALLKKHLPEPVWSAVRLIILNHQGIPHYRGSDYVIDEKRNIIYFNLCKNASTSLREALLDEPAGQGTNFTQRNLRSLPESVDYFKFTFVRNPFSRLYSCYKERIMVSYYQYYLGGYLRQVKDFETFIKKINKIPMCLTDEHFTGQYFCLYKKNQPSPDFIGRYENLIKEFEPIREKYHLNPLPHHRKSQAHRDEWKDHYTRETAAIVYRKYKQDFDACYPEAYAELLAYLDAKSPG